MTSINKKKLRYSLWSLVYLVLTVVIVVSAVSLFKNFYYESVFVSGHSMDPLFVGGEVDKDGNPVPLSHDYGLIDKDTNAKRNVKRFQILTTYYPGDDTSSGSASYKIKRLLVKPGEYYKFVNNDLYVKRKESDPWGEPLKIPFVRNGVDNVETPSILHNKEGHLKDDEYFLAGDNWINSSDSFDDSIGPIKFDLLVGVVVKMQGRCTVERGLDGKTRVTEKQTYKERYFLGVDY